LRKRLADRSPRGRQVARVDRHVGALLERREQLALAADGRLDRAAVGERVAAACLLEAVDEHVLGRLEVQQPVRDTAAVEVVHHSRQAVEEAATAHVRGHRGPLDLAALVAEEVGKRADHPGRQVVDAEVTGVLEGGHRLRLAGAGEAGDEHEVLDRPLIATGHVGSHRTLLT
jgi:hypothetical protein